MSLVSSFERWWAPKNAAKESVESHKGARSGVTAISLRCQDILDTIDEKRRTTHANNIVLTLVQQATVKKVTLLIARDPKPLPK